jgi:hypothetical protein
MNFYKSISILALVVLICCLAFVSVALQSSSKDNVFPPNVSECPDFFVKTTDSGSTTCVANYAAPDSSCTPKSFDDQKYRNPGMGPTSGVCEKKQWAKECGVNWDGITNNPDVCYKTIG